MKKFLFLLTLPFLIISCSSNSGTDTEELDSKHVKPVNLEFLETYNAMELSSLWSTIVDWTKQNDSILQKRKLKPIELNMLDQSNTSNCFGRVKPENISTIDAILTLPEVKALFPKDLKFLWSFKKEKETSRFLLYTVKISSGGDHLNGRHITQAVANVDQYSGSMLINISMNSQGSNLWRKMTEVNVGKCIAIVIDDKVMSCPRVNDVITGGMTQISGDFSHSEAQELADGINAGR